jgi:hypothetical protein
MVMDNIHLEKEYSTVPLLCCYLCLSPPLPPPQMYVSKVWESVWPRGRKWIIASLGQDVTYFSLHPISPLPPGYRSKVESHQFANLWCEPRMELGPVLQQADGLPSELCCTLFELRRTLVLAMPHPDLNYTVLRASCIWQNENGFCEAGPNSKC